MQSLTRIACEWCRNQNDSTTTTCAWCGAPLNVQNLVTESGWREAPRLRDMTEIHFHQSTLQMEGEIVPVAEMALAPTDSVFFEHHVLLWKEQTVGLSILNVKGGKRVFGGMPHVISVATGPGRIAFSKDATGELVILPLHPGMEIDAREHAFLLASHTIDYSFVRIQGLRNVLHSGAGGMFMDRFVTRGEPGLLMLHGFGNVFERQLAADETLHLEPGAFLYKDASVQMEAEKLNLPGGGMFTSHHMWMAKMTGPGRVGIQSMYVHHHTE